MKTLTLKVDGTFSEVSFYTDDTIQRVRELIAIAQNSHPDRMFLQVLVTLPEGYYSTPKEWTTLFLRLSRDGRTVSEEALRVYQTQIRPGASFPIRSYTREQWEEVALDDPLREGGQEWHILGTKTQTVLPLPPRDTPLLTNAIPLLSPQGLYETIHPFPASEIRATLLPADPSDAVLRVYFPSLRPDTPPNLEASKASILAQQAHLAALLALPIKRHQPPSILKAKWVIPLNATSIPSPRSTFENIFYGMTVSETTPYIAYYTAEAAALRSKFYVTNPTTKTPLLTPSLLRAWYDTTKPSRRRPTLLLYRGSATNPVGERSVFQRIAVTSADITVDIRKDRRSTATLETLQKEAETWLRSLDALMPFVDPRDLSLDRWELTDMSLHATYAKEELTFDRMRLPCLQSLFAEQEGVFRLLRTDQPSDAMSRRVAEACQVLLREQELLTAEALAEKLNTSVEEATRLLDEVQSGDINCDRVLRDYPTVTFDRKDVEIHVATDPERVLRYADILRYVLTTDSEAVNTVCPRRQEMVAPGAVVPQQAALAPGAEDEDEDESAMLALLGLSEEPSAPPPPPPPAAAKPSRSLKIAEEQTNTQNYFNDRLKSFNAELFKPPYSKECEKSKQVVLMTPAHIAEIEADPNRGPAYTYASASPAERMEIVGATAICPPYWCMTDLIPLREDQLVKGADGLMHCPVCDGKVRPNDKVSPKEFSVIKRVTSKGLRTPYPRSLKNREGVPCCYPSPATTPKQEDLHPDETYILNEDSREIPPERAARIAPDLAAQLGVKTTYDKTLIRGRLEFGQSDIFRIGLGRPSDTLRRLMADYEIIASGTPIPRPAEKPDIVKQCSFYATSLSRNPIEEFDQRFVDKTLPPLDELEYLSFLLNFSVVLVKLDSPVSVRCGFRTASIAAKRRTLVVFTHEDTPSLEVLGTMARERKGKSDYKTKWLVDATQAPLDEQTARLVQAHQEACSAGAPTIQQAWSAVQALGLTDLSVLVDPNGLFQAFFAAGRAIVPFTATSESPAADFRPVSTKQYHELAEDDLPSYTDQVAALSDLAKTLKDYAHAPDLDHRNAMGAIVEVETVSRFRIPVRPAPSTGPTTEVLETVAKATGSVGKRKLRGEEVLISADPDPEGRKEKDKLDYETELYEFLLMSLAHDIQPDHDGEAGADYAPLREAIRAGDKTALPARLEEWYRQEAYEDKTKTTYKFLSKVRTPCGQLADEPSCSASSLCGWRNGTCKVHVRTAHVKPAKLLGRMSQTLLENSKQRALVLDNRVSPFFSTVLYLEMPHEWITTAY